MGYPIHEKKVEQQKVAAVQFPRFQLEVEGRPQPFRAKLVDLPCQEHHLLLKGQTPKFEIKAFFYHCNSFSIPKAASEN